MIAKFGLYYAEVASYSPHGTPPQITSGENYNYGRLSEK